MLKSEINVELIVPVDLHLADQAVDDLAFRDRFHVLKDLAYQLINDPVQNMCRVARHNRFACGFCCNRYTAPAGPVEQVQ